MSSSRSVRLVAMALVAVFLLGVGVLAGACASPPVLKREMAMAPIAFVYHSEELARRRAESLADSERSEAPDDPRNATQNRGVLNLNLFNDFLGNTFGPRESQQFRGRLALLDPKDKDVSVIEGPQRGAIPHAWSADHRRLLFSQGDPGRLQLFEYDLDTLEVAPKTHGPDPHPQGCYASDGRLVVSVHRKELVPGWGPRPQLTSRLAIQSASGSTQWLTSGPIDGDPACSPDGSMLAYVRILGRDSQIWVQPTTVGAPGRPITPGRDPSFSPDGRWLVFSRDDSDASVLWRIRVDGAGRTKLGQGAGFDEYRPTVSPDGALVVYESVLENRYRLFMRRFDGSGDVVLFASGDGTYAVW